MCDRCQRECVPWMVNAMVKWRITLYYFLNIFSEPIAVSWRSGNLLWPDPIWTDSSLVPQSAVPWKEKSIRDLKFGYSPLLNETGYPSTPHHLWPATKADSRVYYEGVEASQCQDLPCKKTAEASCKRLGDFFFPLNFKTCDGQGTNNSLVFDVLCFSLHHYR